MASSTDIIHYAKNRTIEGFDYDKQGKWLGPFFFVQGADTQLGIIRNYIDKRPDEPHSWEEDLALANLSVDALNAMNPRPKFYVICGDLVDAFPGEPHRANQERDLKECLQRITPEIPIICVCGNHDVGNDPTHESMAVYRKSFGDDYFSFWVQGLKCICLNSQFYFSCGNVPDLRKAMDKWLDDELEDLKTHQAKHVLVFQHIPLFLVKADEEDDYFNYPSEVRKWMIEKLKKAGIRIVFCGHYHRNAGGVSDGIECVVTSAVGGQLGDDKSGFRVVKVLDDVITHKYYAFGEVPTNVDVSKSTF